MELVPVGGGGLIAALRSGAVEVPGGGVVVLVASGGNTDAVFPPRLSASG